MQEHKYPINQWAKDDRPREKLLYTGAENLSHSELLAILIHNGTRQKSAIDLAKEVLKLGQDNLVELGKLSVRELMKIKGIGEAKAITIVAALELGRRRQVGPIRCSATWYAAARTLPASCRPVLKTSGMKYLLYSTSTAPIRSGILKWSAKVVSPVP